MFGLTGFVAGPMIAALFMALWGFFISRRHPAAEPEASVPSLQEPPAE